MLKKEKRNSEVRQSYFCPGFPGLKYMLVCSTDGLCICSKSTVHETYGMCPVELMVLVLYS